jgi:hypothetical protein
MSRSVQRYTGGDRRESITTPRRSVYRPVDRSLLQVSMSSLVSTGLHKKTLFGTRRPSLSGPPDAYITGTSACFVLTASATSHPVIVSSPSPISVTRRSMLQASRRSSSTATPVAASNTFHPSWRNALTMSPRGLSGSGAAGCCRCAAPGRSDSGAQAFPVAIRQRPVRTRRPALGLPPQTLPTLPGTSRRSFLFRIFKR